MLRDILVTNMSHLKPQLTSSWCAFSVVSLQPEVISCVKMNAKLFAISNEKELNGLLSCAGHLISSGQTFLEQLLSSLPLSMLLHTLRIDVFTAQTCSLESAMQ